MYLGPVGIAGGKPFTWSNETAHDIQQRNPSVHSSADAFMTVRGADPAGYPWPRVNEVPPVRLLTDFDCFSTAFRLRFDCFPADFGLL